MAVMRDVSASASIWLIGIVIIVLTSISMNILGPTLPDVLFWAGNGSCSGSANLIGFSLFGCLANSCSKARAGDATMVPMWWYFSAGILFSALPSLHQHADVVRAKRDLDRAKAQLGSRPLPLPRVRKDEQDDGHPRGWPVLPVDSLWRWRHSVVPVSPGRDDDVLRRAILEVAAGIEVPATHISVVGMVISAVLAGYAIPAGKPTSLRSLQDSH